MAISYRRVSNEVFKIVKGLGFSIKMYDRSGKGPLANPDFAKYMYLEPDGIMISLTSESSSDLDEVFIYRGAKLEDQERFTRMVEYIKTVTHMYGIGVTVRTFSNSDRLDPSKMAHRAQAEKEEEKYNESKLRKSFNLLVEKLCKNID